MVFFLYHGFIQFLYKNKILKKIRLYFFYNICYNVTLIFYVTCYNVNYFVSQPVGLDFAIGSGFCQWVSTLLVGLDMKTHGPDSLLYHVIYTQPLHNDGSYWSKDKRRTNCYINSHGSYLWNVNIHVKHKGFMYKTFLYICWCIAITLEFRFHTASHVDIWCYTHARIMIDLTRHVLSIQINEYHNESVVQLQYRKSLLSWSLRTLGWVLERKC